MERELTGRIIKFSKRLKKGQNLKHFAPLILFSAFCVSDRSLTRNEALYICTRSIQPPTPWENRIFSFLLLILSENLDLISIALSSFNQYAKLIWRLWGETAGCTESKVVCSLEWNLKCFLPLLLEENTVIILVLGLAHLFFRPSSSTVLLNE